MVCAKMHYRLRNNFRCSQWYSLVMRLKWKLVLVCFDIVLIMTQDRCIVCTEHTTGSEVIWYAPDRTPR
jgi:hypothetical protein